MELFSSESRALWVGKAWYFLYFASGVCLQPYINVISYRANGMSDAQIGVLASLKPWVSAPASFCWSALADAKRAHRAIFVGTIVASALLHACYAAARSFWAFAALAVVAELAGAPGTLLADAAVMAQAKEEGDYGRSRLYGAWGWGIFGAVGGWAVQRYGAPAAFGGYLLLMVPCAAVACLMECDPLKGKEWRQQQELQQKGLQPKQQQPQKPKQQEHGAATAAAPTAPAASSGGAAAAVELAVHGGSSDQRSGDALAPRDAFARGPALAPELTPLGAGSGLNGSPLAPAPAAPNGARAAAAAARGGGDAECEGAPLLAAGGGGRGAAAAGEAAGAGAGASDAAAPREGGGFWAKLGVMLSCPAVLVFFGQVTIMGFGIGVIGEFLFLYLQELGGSEALMGLTLTVTCASEIPAFMVQGAVLKRVSVEALLHFVIFTYTLRLALYWALPAAGTAWAVLPIELLHGITFGCGWGGGTVQCKRLAQRLGVSGLEATMQGIFQGLYFGVGQGLGALLGGLLMQRHGGRAMFAQASAITLAAWAACAAAERAALGGGGGSWRGAALWRPRAGPGGAITRGDYGRITSKASGPDLSHMRPAAAEPV